MPVTWISRRGVILKHQPKIALATVLLALAALLRLWGAAQLPPGFSDNELAHIRITEAVRAGSVSVYYQAGDGRVCAGLYGVLNSVLTEAVGDGLLGYRALSFFAGMLTLATAWALTRRLFGGTVALVTLGALAVNGRAVTLARTASAEAFVPLFTLLVLWGLVVAFHLRRKVRFAPPSTPAFAVLGGLLGAAGYLHYSALALGPLAVLFFVHLRLTHQPLSRRVWGAWGFVIVLATIVGTPYLISTFRDRALSEPYSAFWAQRPADLGVWARGALNALGGLFLQGDPDPARNVGGLPLMGVWLAMLWALGTVQAVRRWRDPRHALLLLSLGAGLLTDAWVGERATFSANLVALPAVYMLVGVGAWTFWERLQRRGVRVAWQLSVLFVVFALGAEVGIWRAQIVEAWEHDEATARAYHANIGRLAAYLDRTPDGLPISFCAAGLREPSAGGLSPRQMLSVMMHREGLPIRSSDCRGGLVLVNAGAPMRFAFADRSDRERMPPELQEWLEDAEPIHVPGLPDGAVLRVDVEQRVRDAGGYWAAKAPTFYMPDENTPPQPVQLPARMEGNLSFAGYDPRVWDGEYVAGGPPIVLVTYWRVDGELPPELGIFAHLLAYPDPLPEHGARVPLLEPWAEANTLDVVPAELRERDFFVQVSYLWLADTLKAADYALTVGAYVDTAAVLENHLRVLDPTRDYQPRSDRLWLGDLHVRPAETAPPTDESK